LTAIPDDLRFSIVNSPGRRSYPISTTSWAILYAKQPRGKGKLLADFLRWAIHDGQQYEEPVSYAPLPKALVSRAELQLARLAAQP
jgi:phosphate transport system substrate-binding protein